MVIAITVHPATPLGPLLERQPLKWVGTRSYGIYLWHWPIFMVSRPGFELSGNPYLLFVLRTALTFGIAELSYRLVEAPIRRHGFRAWMRQLRGMLGVRTLRGASVMAAAMIATVAIIGTGLVLGATRPPAVTIASQAVSDGEAIPDLTSADEEQPPNEVVATTTTTPPTVDEPIADEEPTSSQSADEPPAESAPTPAPSEDVPGTDASSSDATTTTIELMPDVAAVGPSEVSVSIIGDSVVAGAQPAIEAEFGSSAVVDATVSRQFKHASDVVQAMRADGTLGDVVIVHLGTNGAFSGETLDALVGELADVERIILVNAKVPRRWEGRVNATIADGLTRWPQVELVDWHTIAANHPEWFAGDKVHLNGDGRVAYAALLAEAVGR